MTQPTIPASFLGIGDTTFAACNSGVALAAGDIVLGSDLRTMDALVFWEMSSTPIPYPVTSGAALAGTWRSMCKVAAPTDSVVWPSLFLRVT